MLLTERKKSQFQVMLQHFSEKHYYMTFTTFSAHTTVEGWSSATGSTQKGTQICL